MGPAGRRCSINFPVGLRRLHQCGRDGCTGASLGTISTSQPWSWIDSTGLGCLILAFDYRRSCFVDRLLCLVLQNSWPNTLRVERNGFEICPSVRTARLQHVVDSFLLSSAQ